MLSFGQWIDRFERTMAAAAFAESNDPTTARRIMEPDTHRSVRRVSDKVIEQPASRPQLRM